MSSNQGPWSDAGQYLQSLRLNLEITAGELAEQAKAPSRQWVLDMENGRRAVPSSMYASLAEVYGLSVREFAATCLRHYDRKAYNALFSDADVSVAVAA